MKIIDNGVYNQIFVVVNHWVQEMDNVTMKFYLDIILK